MTVGLTPRLDSIVSGTQGFVDQSSLITVPYTTIVNRAQIPDIANDLRASLGIDRIQTQQIYLIQNEQGANGEPVYGVVNDDRGLIRFVGAGWPISSGTGASGSMMATSTANGVAFVEVVFYGTGLHVLTSQNADGRDMRVAVDGGSLGSNIYLGASSSAVINGRNYVPNTVMVAASGLTLGMHTVRIELVTLAMTMSGFEILNSNATGLININPGTAYYKGAKYVNSTIDSIAYNKDQSGTTIVTGTKGGRIVRAITANDTISTYWQAVDTSVAYGNSASHTNEEVARVYYPREFGAGRYASGVYANQDDFSLMTGSGRAAAFTLDDGSTTLMCGIGGAIASYGSTEGLVITANSQFIVFTFIGCGLDIFLNDTAAGGSDSYTYQIDGGTATAWFNTAGNTALRVQKIVSGLSYGTHTFTLTRVTAATWSPVLVHFKVYQPKKPALPVGAVEICDYNVMGNLVQNSTASVLTISTGVLHKSSSRELVFVNGTGGTSDWFMGPGEGVTTCVGGFNGQSDRGGAYIEYTFFGTGFEFRGRSRSDTSSNITVLVDSLAATTTNFAGITAWTYGTGVTYSGLSGASITPTTNVFVLYNATGSYGCGMGITGLPLGKHTVRFTNNTAGAYLFMNALHIITPIHVHKSNLYATLQNTLSIGSQSLSDTRAVAPYSAPKAWAQAVGVASGPTTTNVAPSPCPDLSVTIKTNGGPLFCSWEILALGSGTQYTFFVLWVDGSAYGGAYGTNLTSFTVTSGNILIPVAAGIHKIDVCWYNNSAGTITCNGINRILTVREL